jgi:hypothetical protein
MGANFKIGEQQAGRDGDHAERVRDTPLKRALSA